MHLIDVSRDQSTDMIARAAAHLPIGVSLGRILVVTPIAIMVRQADGTAAVYGVDDTDDYTWRMVDIDDEWHERTGWRNGEEIVRHVFRVPSGD